MKNLVRIHWASVVLSVLLSLCFVQPWGYALFIVSLAMLGLALTHPDYKKNIHLFILPRIWLVGRFRDWVVYIICMCPIYFYALIQPPEVRFIFFIWIALGAVSTPAIFFCIGSFLKKRN